MFLLNRIKQIKKPLFLPCFITRHKSYKTGAQIVYDKLVEGDYILCVNPATSEFVIYDIKLEMYDNYKSLRRKLDELYTEKKYLIYLIK